MKKITISFLIVLFLGFYVLYHNNLQKSPTLGVIQQDSSNSFNGSPVSFSDPNASTDSASTTAPAQTTNTSSPAPAPSRATSTSSKNTTTTKTVPKSTSPYADGTYTGISADAFYGFVQVRTTISGGRISNITFLSYPSDRSTSLEINSQATPLLAQEAIKAQSANVDTVSGATDTSGAFRQSLSSALAKAKNG